RRVVYMWGHTYRTTTYADENLFLGEKISELRWDSTFSSQAEIVWCSQFFRRRRKPEFSGGACEGAGEGTTNPLDVGNPPIEDLLHGSLSGRQEGEVRALAHIETSCAILIFRGV